MCVFVCVTCVLVFSALRLSWSPYSGGSLLHGNETVQQVLPANRKSGMWRPALRQKMDSFWLGACEFNKVHASSAQQDTPDKAFKQSTFNVHWICEKFQLKVSVCVPVLRCVWRGKDGACSDVSILKWGSDVRGAVWPITTPSSHLPLWWQRLCPPLGRTGMATGKLRTSP